jgi:synaptobrevin family protein YKT6
MKIIAVYVVDCQSQEFMTKNNLSFVSFLNRNSVKELLDAYVLHIVCDLQSPERKILEHESYIFSCHRIEQQGCVIVTDHEYPTRVSFNILTNVFQDTSQQHLQAIIEQYQDPRCIDKLTRIQNQLDETLVVMHENITLVLERGQNIDELVASSERLSQQSKMFYKVARQHNRCCIIC